MVTVRSSAENPFPPESILAAATDFTSRRPDLWPTLCRRCYQVRAVEETSAEATEASEVLGGIWARERYGWPSPGVVRAKVQDSNFFRSGSWWEFRLRHRPGRGSSLE